MEEDVAHRHKLANSWIERFALDLERRIAPLAHLPVPGPNIKSVAILWASNLEHVEIALEHFFSRDSTLEILLLGADESAKRQLDSSAALKTIHNLFPFTTGSIRDRKLLEQARRADACLVLYSSENEGGPPRRARWRMGAELRHAKTRIKALVDGQGFVWSPTLSHRLQRRLLRGLSARLTPQVERQLAAAIRTRALPDLGPDAQREMPPCAHERRRFIVAFPRPIYQCEDCRVGLTPPWLDAADYDRIYGSQYHTRWLVNRRSDGGPALRAYQQRRLDNMAVVGIDTNIISAAQALDFGCGTGGLAAALAEKGACVTGVDLSSDSIDFARLIFPNITFQTAQDDLANITGPFDLIVMSHVLEHVPDPPALLARLRTLAPPGGRIYIEVPWADATTWAGDARAWRNIEHLWEFNKMSLARLLTNAGVEDIRIADTVELTNGTEGYLAASARFGRANNP